PIDGGTGPFTSRAEALNGGRGPFTPWRATCTGTAGSCEAYEAITGPGRRCHLPEIRTAGNEDRAMGPKRRGRPPGRGRGRKGTKRPASGRRPGSGVSTWEAEETTYCWFDEPLHGDRRSWAVPPGHGTYRGLDLERLDPDDEDERTFLLEAQHPEM